MQGAIHVCIVFRKEASIKNALPYVAELPTSPQINLNTTKL